MAISVTDAEKSISNALADGRITNPDAAALRDFLSDARATNGISPNRINLYASSLCRMARFLPGGLIAASAADLYAGVADLRGPTAYKGRPYKQNTLQSTITIVRLFYRWAAENGYTEIPQPRIDRLKPPHRDRMTKTAGQMLTPEDVQAIAGACRRSSDRAILWMLYEGGFRVGELIEMTWGQVTFDQYGVVVNVDEKTDRPRYVRLIMAAKPLAAWRADYYFDPTPETPVFLDTRCRPITRAGVTQMLRRAARRAEVEKHITAHLFRHSRITHLIKEGVNESVIKLMMWGNINTDMFATYAHLTGVDIDAEMLRTYGIAPEPKQRHQKLAPIQCPKCGQVWPAGWRVCECGEILDEDLKKTALDKEKYAQESGDYQKLLAQLRRDLRIEDR
ncbi:MAG: site-specific integrase [Bacilli bacterium]|jgi:site-specific recombinase XerD